jgi:hypothetical protein
LDSILLSSSTITKSALKDLIAFTTELVSFSVVVLKESINKPDAKSYGNIGFTDLLVIF